MPSTAGEMDGWTDKQQSEFSILFPIQHQQQHQQQQLKFCSKVLQQEQEHNYNFIPRGHLRKSEYKSWWPTLLDPYYAEQNDVKHVNTQM